MVTLPQSQVVMATYMEGASGTSGKDRMPCSRFSRKACEEGRREGGREGRREGGMAGGSAGQPSRLCGHTEKKERQL